MKTSICEMSGKFICNNSENQDIIDNLTLQISLHVDKHFEDICSSSFEFQKLIMGCFDYRLEMFYRPAMSSFSTPLPFYKGRLFYLIPNKKIMLLF